LDKNHDLGKIADALQVIAAGGGVFDPTGPNRGSPPSSRQRRGSPPYPLNPPGKEKLRRIVAGQSTRHMGKEMNITTSTLRTYVKNVLAKLGAHSRLEAAAVATRENVLDELSA